MKKKKYLNFYKKCMKTGLIPKRKKDGSNYGLCGNFGKHVMEMFEPTVENCKEYNVVSWGYWAADCQLVDKLYRWEVGFSPTRQNIVLLLACMHNEY